VEDVLGDGDGAAHTAPVSPSNRKAKKEQRRREFMARKFQTYARPSTTNASTERRGYKFLYVEAPMFVARKFPAL
jgi:hypothetical protein